MAPVAEIFAVLVAAVAHTEPQHLEAAPCAAADDDKNVFKLASKLIPVLQEQLKDQSSLPKEIKGIKGIFVLNVTQDGKHAGTWHMVAYGGDKPPEIREGKPTEKATLTTTISDELMLKLAVGKANPIKTFMSGKIKISGNLMMAQKLEALFRANNGYERTRALAMDLAKDNAYLRSKL